MQPEPARPPATRLSAAHRLALGIASAALLGSFVLGITDTLRDSRGLPSIDLEPLRRGQAYFAAGELRQAEREFEIAAEILTTDPAPLLALATTLGELGDAGTQLAAVREAARRAPDDARTQLALGSALADSGDIDNARAALERSVELDPSGVEARINLGIVELRANRPAIALARFDEALTIDPNNEVAKAAAAQARARLERAAPGASKR